MTEHPKRENVRGIYLIGFSGTKSIIAKVVGTRCCNGPFAISTTLSSNAAVLTIPVIFQREGESGFRARNRSAACGLCQRTFRHRDWRRNRYAAGERDLMGSKGWII